MKLLLPFVGSIAIAATGFAAAEVYEHKAPWGLYDSRASARKDVVTWKATAATNAATAAAWEASFHKSEALRKSDQAAAAKAIDANNATLTARVAEARRSGEAILTLITKEPAHDAQGCPARQLVPASELCHALGTCSTGPAASASRP